MNETENSEEIEEDKQIVDPYAYNNNLALTQKPQILEKIVDLENLALNLNRTRSKLEYDNLSIMKKTSSLVVPRPRLYSSNVINSSHEDL